MGICQKRQNLKPRQINQLYIFSYARVSNWGYGQ